MNFFHLLRRSSLLPLKNIKINVKKEHLYDLIKPVQFCLIYIYMHCISSHQLHYWPMLWDNIKYEVAHIVLQDLQHMPPLYKATQPVWNQSIHWEQRYLWRKFSQTFHIEKNYKVLQNRKFISDSNHIQVQYMPHKDKSHTSNLKSVHPQRAEIIA